MEFKKHSLLKKYLGDFDDEHPLLVNFDLNPKYVKYVDNLLREVETIPNFKIKINEMKDIGNWKSSFSELEFVSKLRSFNPEFIKTTKGIRTPDIETEIQGKKVFFDYCYYCYYLFSSMFIILGRKDLG